MVDTENKPITSDIPTFAMSIINLKTDGPDGIELGK